MNYVDFKMHGAKIKIIHFCFPFDSVTCEFCLDRQAVNYLVKPTGKR